MRNLRSGRIYIYFRLAFAHLFFRAATILARPCALIVLRLGARGGKEHFSGAAWPVSSPNFPQGGNFCVDALHDYGEAHTHNLERSPCVATGTISRSVPPSQPASTFAKVSMS